MSYTGQSFYAPNTLERPVKSAILSGSTKLVGENGQEFDSYFTIHDKMIIGKGIDDGNGVLVVSSNDVSTEEFLPLPQPPFIITGNSRWKKIVYYDSEKQFISSIRHETSDVPVSSTPTNAKYCRFGYSNTVKDNTFKLVNNDGLELDYPKLSMQSVKMPVLTTSNEDGTKTNILTVNEEVELRGIGDVRDTLDLISGEAIQLLNDVEITGDENFVYFSSGGSCVKCSFITSKNVGSNAGLLCDKLPINNSLWGDSNIEGIRYNGNDIHISIDKTKLESYDINGFGKYIKSIGGLQLIYKEPNPIIKTVDLTILDQNGQNVKQLMSFNGGTHFNTMSTEGSPLPSASVTVETDLEEILKVCSLEGNTM